MEILLIFLLFIIFIEIILILSVKILKKKFKWLINNEDEYPIFSKQKLKKFYNNSYDKELGWDRKKNSNGSEFNDKKTFFKISQSGRRGIAKFNKDIISVFGDSFAFCRYVNDDETWESSLEKKLKANIHNFGVGNYGLDQSFLKFLKYKNKLTTNIIVFNVVPETIARINSYWKHYREFGNILGFKPVFEFENNKLRLRKNILKNNFDQKQIHKIISKIKKIDIFYEKKFLKNKFHFPYTFNLLRNIFFYSKIIIYLTLQKITKKQAFYNNALRIILRKNIEESHLMYKDKKYSEKLEFMILYIYEKLKKNNFKMILLISPQLLDFTEGNYSHVLKFYKEIAKKIPCIDMYEKIKNRKFEKYYFKDIYGGHFNKKGNKFVSEILFNFYKNKKNL